MPGTSLLDLGRLDIKLGVYAVGSATALSDPTLLTMAQDYRRTAAARMIPIGKEDIGSRIPNGQYLVSRKLDGEFTLLVFEQGEIFTINPGGTVRVGMPWMVGAKEALQSAGVQSARIAGELYVQDGARRTRVHDVSTLARGPRDLDDLQKLRFAPFDLIEMNGQSASEVYAATLQTLDSLFGKTLWCQPVQYEVAKDQRAIGRLYEQWVQHDQAEGVVVRSDTFGIFKIKPRHTLDVVVVGFTESTDDRQGMLHDLLVAVARNDGSLHCLTRVGGGFTDQQRRQFLSDLKDMVVASEYVEVNSDYVAYQMVKPRWVVEISCLDLVSQTTRGAPINRMVIEYDQASGYKVVRRMPLASVISPQFVRRREDKQPKPDEIRIAQISHHVEVELVDADAKAFNLPDAQVIQRQLYTKTLKGAVMVRKFVLIKTNKDQPGGDFPAYVAHYTDFSPNRADPLQREVLISNSLEQIEELYGLMLTENVKKGWLKV